MLEMAASAQLRPSFAVRLSASHRWPAAPQCSGNHCHNFAGTTRSSKGARIHDSGGVCGINYWTKSGILLSRECDGNFNGRLCVRFEVPLNVCDYNDIGSLETQLPPTVSD